MSSRTFIQERKNDEVKTRMTIMLLPRKSRTTLVRWLLSPSLCFWLAERFSWTSATLLRISPLAWSQTSAMSSGLDGTATSSTSLPSLSLLTLAAPKSAVLVDPDKQKMVSASFREAAKSETRTLGAPGEARGRWQSAVRRSRKKRPQQMCQTYQETSCKLQKA